MVSQDAPVVIDDQEFEPAREHGLAVGKQHLPAERHNVAPEARGIYYGRLSEMTSTDFRVLPEESAVAF